MKWVLYLISFLWIGGGTCLVLYSQESRAFFRKTLRGVDSSLLSIIPITIGALLIVGAYQSTAFWFITVLGILAIGKGCLFIFNPQKRADRLLSWFLDTASEQTYRLAGIIAIILGTAVLSWI